MTKTNSLKLHAKVAVVALVIMTGVTLSSVVRADNSASVYALVAYNGKNSPINISSDKTAIFERKYDKHNDIDKVLSNWALIGFEVVVMVALVALLLEIKKAIPKVEDALTLSKKKV